MTSENVYGNFWKVFSSQFLGPYKFFNVKAVPVNKFLD